MNIIVVGLGKIGKTIIENVAKEGHNIVAIDTNADFVNSIIETYDVNGVVGNGASYEIQKQADVEHADLFIAVTSTDEVNIMACMLAKNTGADYTIARVRNPEYLQQVEMMKSKLGLSMIINPEYEAAREVKRVITFPDAQHIETFEDGKIDLVEIIVKKQSHLIGQSLAEMNKDMEIQILVGGVVRDNEIIIPTGNFVFQADDKVYLIAKPMDLAEFFQNQGLIRTPIHYLMVIGGGKISYYLATLCADKKYKIKIFEQDYDLCEHLNEALPNATIVHGDGTDYATLESEGFKEAEACVALTGNDEVNMILSLYAQKEGMKKVFAKVNRDNLVPLLGETSTTIVISPRNIIANQITSVIRGKSNLKGSNVSTVYKLVNDELEALEFVVKENFNGRKIPLREIKLKPNILVVGIVRAGNIIIPGGNDDIRLGDRVLIITSHRMFDDLNDILA
ncbi:MAG: Trk system potassium transporter TrkA [Bacilli bacterium]